MSNYYYLLVMADDQDRFTPSTPALQGTDFHIPQTPSPIPIEPINPHAPDASDEYDEEPDEDDEIQLAPPPAPIPVSPVRPAVNRITSEDAFWRYVKTLEWRDASEDHMFNMNHKKAQFLSLSIPDQEAFAGFLNNIVGLLEDRFTEAGFWGSFNDPQERKAFCSHIVGKGFEMYLNTIDDPGFASYLLPANAGKREYFNMLEIIPS